MSHRSSYLALKAHTWPAHGEGLFDYQARSLVTDAYKIAAEYFLVRVGDHVRPVTSLSDYSETAVLARITRHGDSFSISSDPHNDSLWLSIKFLKENSHALAVGSVMKVAEVTVETIAVQTESETEENAEEVGFETVGPDEGCRICYSDWNTADDPLISPCLCTGTMRFIHVKCLQQSVTAGMTSRTTPQAVSYQWKELKCRVCQSQLPLVLPTKQLIVPLPRTAKPHIILKAAASDFSAICVVTPERQEATIGRGHDCDIVLPVASVSRLHAKLKFEEGQFVLQDCDSRFGTSVKVSHYEFAREVVGLQMGKTMITFKAG